MQVALCLVFLSATPEGSVEYLEIRTDKWTERQYQLVTILHAKGY